MQIEDLCKGYDYDKLDEEVRNNLLILCDRISLLEIAYGKPFVVTSGFRSMEDHLRIYKEKCITKVPMKSKHLFGCALDISDITGELTKWCFANENKLVEYELWGEMRQGVWLHLQSEPPASKKRWFFP